MKRSEALKVLSHQHHHSLFARCSSRWKRYPDVCSSSLQGVPGTALARQASSASRPTGNLNARASHSSGSDSRPQRLGARLPAWWAPSRRIGAETRGNRPQSNGIRRSAPRVLGGGKRRSRAENRGIGREPSPWLWSRRSRVRVPSLTLKSLQIGQFSLEVGLLGRSQESKGFAVPNSTPNTRARSEGVPAKPAGLRRDWPAGENQEADSLVPRSPPTRARGPATTATPRGLSSRVPVRPKRDRSRPRAVACGVGAVVNAKRRQE
jgi:hypothetical protein